ncbi:MAG: hypothetical protein LBQ87_00835 [Candidatus Fibromonas sp.]|jgi:hypothetical protein|nr:hypothetical protein [Candidatus Fibromonas sp.]
MFDKSLVLECLLKIEETFDVDEEIIFNIVKNELDILLATIRNTQNIL